MWMCATELNAGRRWTTIPERAPLEGKDGPGQEEIRRRAEMCRLDFDFKRRTLRRFMRRFAMTLEVPELSDRELEELEGTTPSAEQIAERLGRHPESIRRNLREGDLKGQRFGKEWVVADEALRGWLPTPLYEEAFGDTDQGEQ